MTGRSIPVNAPLLDGNEKAYLAECIDSGWISSEGPFVNRLEAGVAARVGRAHGVAVCNGSAALELAVAALGIGPGDEVILPSFTIISCANAIVRAGATPVVVDCDPLTWNMDAEQVAAAVTSRSRAIMAVHIYGLPVDMDAIGRVATRHGLAVIEDASQALGQSVRGRPCGSFGDVSTFSFYPNKLLTTGEGGMVVADDPAIAGRLRSLRNLGFREPRFVHDVLGWNFRLSNLQAAVGLAQLERLDEFVARKRRVGTQYCDLLAGTAGLQLPERTIATAENLYWVVGVILDDSVDFEAREASARLSQRGVGTRPFFWPMHEQPVLRAMGLFAGVECPVASRIARRGFYLPSGLALTEADVRVAAGHCRAVLEAA